MRVLLPLLALAACDPQGASLVRRGAPADDTGPPEDTGEAPPDDGDLDPDDDGSQPLGVDVSHWNGDIDWAQVAADGLRFSFAKVSESIDYIDDQFPVEDSGAAAAGLLHGGYHFAIPDDAEGYAQADFFVDNGGGWTDDGATLPGVLDIEYNPYGGTCYGLSRGEMAAWIRDFTEEYRALTGRAAIVYTTADWWQTCVDSDAFGDRDPLWVAHYGVDRPNLPDGWEDWTFWQTTSTGRVAGIDGDTDLNLYRGTLTALRAYARGR